MSPAAHPPSRRRARSKCLRGALLAAVFLAPCAPAALADTLVPLVGVLRLEAFDPEPELHRDQGRVVIDLTPVLLTANTPLPSGITGNDWRLEAEMPVAGSPRYQGTIDGGGLLAGEVDRLRVGLGPQGSFTLRGPVRIAGGMVGRFSPRGQLQISGSSAAVYGALSIARADVPVPGAPIPLGSTILYALVPTLLILGARRRKGWSSG